jgi:hypothetical protein
MRIPKNYGDFTGSLIKISIPAYVCLAAQLAIRCQFTFGDGAVTRVFTKFRILEISYISNVFFYFVYYTKVATISRK